MNKTKTDNLYYLNEDHSVERCATIEEWLAKFDRSNRIVEQSAVRKEDTQDVLGTLSTVFLGIDHQYGDGPPLIFETMFFPATSDGDNPLRRYSTWDEAVKGHAEWKTLLEQGTPLTELP